MFLVLYFFLEELWCCVEGIEVGGKIELLVDGWFIQMYGQYWMNLREIFVNEYFFMKVFFSGNWLNVFYNLGFYVRYCYGQEVYKYVEYWLLIGKQFGWDVYEIEVFSLCFVKGFYGCFD